ncbi:MAG: hypothetical protein ACLFR0_05705 [Alphaproteobacteria bacterium]
MSRLLQAKKNIILHFGERSSWINLYDDNFLDSALRRSITTTHGSITKKVSRDEKFVRLSFDPRESRPNQAVLNWLLSPANTNASDKKPSFVEFLQDGEYLRVRDESDRVFTIPFSSEPNDKYEINANGVNSASIDKAYGQFGDTSMHEINLNGLVISVYFADDGRKSILIDDNNLAYIFEEPTDYSQTPAIFTKFLNRVTFDQGFVSELGLDLKQEFLNPAKLFVAVDLGVEPDIKVFNKIDENNGMALLAYLIERRDDGLAIDADSADYDVSLLQKSWEDSIDFEGHYIAVSRQFGIAYNDDPAQYHFNFSADTKEFLMAQGMVLNHITGEGLPPSPMLQKNPTLQNFVHVLDQAGQLIPGHQEKDVSWRTIIIESDKAGAMARQARQMFIDCFGNDFSRNFVSSVRFDENFYLLAVREDAFETAKNVLDASLQAMSLIRNNSQDVSLFRELLTLGASLRYVDPDNAQKGEAFSTLLRKAGNHRLLKICEDVYGSSDINFISLDCSN